MNDRPLRILQTCFSPSYGGLEMQALEMSCALERRGHRVWLAVTTGSRLALEARQAGLGTLEFAVRGPLHPHASLRLARHLATHEVDIVHAQHSGDLGTLVPAARLAARRVPVVLSKRVGSYIAKKDPWHGWLYAGVARVLAVSEVIRRNVSDTTPVPPERVRTLHDAVDLGRFVPGSADRRAVRASLGLEPDDIGIGFVGRFSPGKGHEELLKAAAALKPRHPRARFVVVGEASRGEEDYEASVRDLAHQLGLEDTVTFAGFRRDVPEVMEAFEVFAFPSHAEAFGMVAIEAMAMARPVVATGSDGILDIVVDGETGLLFPRADAGALATALARLVEDPALRERLGRAGRSRVEREFERERQIERLEGHYREVLAAPAGGEGAAG